MFPHVQRPQSPVLRPGTLARREDCAEGATAASSKPPSSNTRRGAVLVRFPVRRSARRTRVLFVCRSHTVLSPMAGGLAREAYRRLEIDVRSAGLAARPVDPRAVLTMAEVGIDISHTIPTLVCDLDLAEFDVVVSLGMHKLGLARQQTAVAWDVPEFTRVTDATALPRLRDLRAQLSARVHALGAMLTATHRA